MHKKRKAIWTAITSDTANLLKWNHFPASSYVSRFSSPPLYLASCTPEKNFFSAAFCTVLYIEYCMYVEFSK